MSDGGHLHADAGDGVPGPKEIRSRLQQLDGRVDLDALTEEPTGAPRDLAARDRDGGRAR